MAAQAMPGRGVSTMMVRCARDSPRPVLAPYDDPNAEPARSVRPPARSGSCRRAGTAVTGLRFDAFHLDTATRELSREGVVVALPPRVFACLALLARHRDRAMGRDELIEAMWDGRGATDVQLAQLVLQCRRAVDDDGQRQRVIRTVAGFGYRWVAPVMEGPIESSPPPVAAEPAADARTAQAVIAEPMVVAHRRLPMALTALAFAGIALVLAWLLVARESPAPVAGGGALVMPLRVEDPEMSWLRLGGLDVVVERLRRNRVPVLSSETSVALSQSPGLASTGQGPTAQAALRRLRETSGADAVIGLRAVRAGGLWQVEADIHRGDHDLPMLEARDEDPVRALRMLADRISGALGHVAAEPGTAPGHGAVAITLQQARAALLANEPARARELLLANPALVRDEPLLRQQLAEVDIRAGRYAQAREALDALLATGEGDALFRAQLLEARGMVAVRGGRFAEAGADFSEALSLLGADGDALALGRAYLGRGISRTSLQDYTGALADNALARAAFQRSGDIGSIARVDSNTGALEILRGHMAQADAYLQRALAKFRDLGFVQERVNALQLAFVAARARLEHAAAAKAIDEVWGLRDRIVSPSSKWSVGLYRVEWQLWNGDLAAADALLATLAATAQPAAAAEQERLHLLRAALERDRGNPDAAWLELEPIPDAAHASADDDSVRAEVTLLRARLARELGRAADVAAAPADAIEPANPRTPLRLLAEAHRALARDDAEAARQAFEAALALADEQAVPRTLVAVAVDYGGELLTQGRLAEAGIVAARAALWADTDFDSALLQLRLARAGGNRAAWVASLERVRRLAGERAIPAELAEPPSS